MNIHEFCSSLFHSLLCYAVLFICNSFLSHVAFPVDHHTVSKYHLPRARSAVLLLVDRAMRGSAPERTPSTALSSRYTPAFQIQLVKSSLDTLGPGPGADLTGNSLHLVEARGTDAQCPHSPSLSRRTAADQAALGLSPQNQGETRRLTFALTAIPSRNCPVLLSPYARLGGLSDATWHLGRL